MTTTEIIKILTDVEHQLARRKNNALARGQWAKAIGIEAQEELCMTLRGSFAAPENQEGNIQTLPKV